MARARSRPNCTRRTLTPARVAIVFRAHRRDVDPTARYTPWPRSAKVIAHSLRRQALHSPPSPCRFTRFHSLRPVRILVLLNMACILHRSHLAHFPSRYTLTMLCFSNFVNAMFRNLRDFRHKSLAQSCSKNFPKNSKILPIARVRTAFSRSGLSRLTGITGTVSARPY